MPQLLGSSGNFEVIVFGLLMLVVLHRFAEGLWPTLARSCPALHAARRARCVRPCRLPEPQLPPVRAQVLLQASDASKRFG